MASKDDCPCGSRRPYKLCCAPFHRGEREAPDPEALMRSRFAAFAKKEAAYLVRTLHPEHEDRQRDEATLVREIKASAGTFRYAGLTILDRDGPDPDGRAHVLFLARVFDKSQDRSFVELSEFAHDGGGWRYLQGIPIPVRALKSDPTTLTIATFPSRR